MSSRILGMFASLLLALAAGAWWWIVDAPSTVSPTAMSARGEHDARAAQRAPGTTPDTAMDADSSGPRRASVPAVAEVVPLALDGGLSAADRVRDLSQDLRILRRVGFGAEARRLIALRMERFVVDVVAADQVESAVRLVEQSFHDALTHDDWAAARWIGVLAGLGAEGLVLGNWRSLPADQQPHALLALAWDPLRTADGLRLDPSEAADFTALSRVLPLTLGRGVSRAAEPMLLALLDREHEGYRGDRFRDVAAVVLGVMVDRRPDLLAAVVDMMRAHPDECQAGLYVLLAARSLGAQRALISFRRRPPQAQSPGSDAAHGYERTVRALAHLESGLRADELADFDGLSRRLDGMGDERLIAAGGMLALVLGNRESNAGRAAISDRLSAALLDELDADVAWTELLALLLLHNQELYRPHTSIGYGSDRTLDQRRQSTRLSAFSHRLVVGSPAERLLAVMGMFGHAADVGGVSVSGALRAAMRTEQDATVARWIRLALRFY